MWKAIRKAVHGLLVVDTAHTVSTRTQTTNLDYRRETRSEARSERCCLSPCTSNAQSM